MAKIDKDTQETQLALICLKIDNLQTDVKTIKENMDHNLVSLERFRLVERIVYGLVSLVIIAFFAGLIKLVFL
jgi:hypothetical protein